MSLARYQHEQKKKKALTATEKKFLPILKNKWNSTFNDSKPSTLTVENLKKVDSFVTAQKK